VNVAFPLHFADGATATCPDDDHVREMIEQLLFTNPGERVMRPELGSGLLQLVFAPNSPELAGALQFAMQAALQQYLGDLIRVSELEASAEESTLRIDLRYVVIRTGEERAATIERSVAG
jgi:phage baseplate assembly protein W